MTRPRSAAQRRETAISGFFMRVEHVRRTAAGNRCELTRPLFPLVLILDADGTLAADCRPLVEMVAA